MGLASPSIAALILVGGALSDRSGWAPLVRLLCLLFASRTPEAVSPSRQAAASLLEAEVVTADGEVRVVNECSEPDLFFALKGGGGGTFGVVTRVTLATHALPPTSEPSSQR